MPKKVRKAVFPAAGLGTRFLPATKASPKEMLPLVDKPLIQYVVEEAVASGIESVIIVTGRSKAPMEDHFDISFELENGVYKIKDMVEKPNFSEAPSDLAIIGRYVLTPDIFDEIEKTAPGAIGEIQITDAMRSLLKKRTFYAVRFKGTRHDAGDKLGFLMATVEFALKRKDLAPDFREYLKSLKL
ncbi:MAG: UTP--glucose-1-phosphate uridylyltransferase [Acidobacteria bacterium]|nr:UTP--glucose-1-phosphate uridylyltransferase [Acidobacteriota bacterium]